MLTIDGRLTAATSHALHDSVPVPTVESRRLLGIAALRDLTHTPRVIPVCRASAKHWRTVLRMTGTSRSHSITVQHVESSHHQCFRASGR